MQSSAEEPRFPTNGEPKLLTKTAERRAFAVVHQEQRARLNEVYLAELAVLKRRGLTVVAKDLGIELPAEDESTDEQQAA